MKYPVSVLMPRPCKARLWKNASQEMFDVRLRVGLGEKRCVFLGAAQRLLPARSQDNSCIKPAPTNPLRQRETIHSAGHVYVGKQCVHRNASKNLDGFGRIGCLDNLKSRASQAARGYQTQEYVVFYNQDDRRGRRLLLLQYRLPRARS
jgi:hypothetical protein